MDKDLAVRLPASYIEKYKTWQELSRDPDIQPLMGEIHHLAIDAYIDAPQIFSLVCYATHEEREQIKQQARGAGLPINKYMRAKMGLQNKPCASSE